MDEKKHDKDDEQGDDFRLPLFRFEEEEEGKDEDKIKEQILLTHLFVYTEQSFLNILSQGITNLYSCLKMYMDKVCR